MPNHETIMQHIYSLVSEGAGMALPRDVQAALHARYDGWIGKKKDKVATSPQEVWEAKEGLAIQEKLREVGRVLKGKSSSLALSSEDVDACCAEVETASTCPHCPDPPDA